MKASHARLLPFLIAVVAISARWIPGPRTIDDSFITYRYARNLLEGSGFVYNPGERVLGTTTPLYTILLAAIGRFTGGASAPFPTIAVVLNALADAATCLLLYRMGKRLGYPLAGLSAGLIWAVAPYSVTFAIGGLETSLYVLLLTATMSLYLEGRTAPAAGTAVLSLLTRPDALLLVGPLALDRILIALRGRHYRPLVREAFIFCIPGLAWLGFASLYFGTPVPHSVLAKSIAYHLPADAAFIRLMQHYATPFLGHLTFGMLWIGVGLVLYPALYTIGSLGIWRKDHRSWPLLAYPWLYFGVYALANPLIFRWYLTPPLPIYFLTILIGANRLIKDLSSRTAAGSARPADPFRTVLARGMLPLFVLLFPLSMTLNGWTLYPDHGPARPAPEMAWFRLELLYRQAAEELRPRMGPGRTLAAGDVGVLGYFTSAHILDAVGLNSPTALEYYPLDPSNYIINYAIPPDLILDVQPDYLVLLEVYGREGLLKDPRFRESYRLLEKYPTDIYSSDGMLVFARVDAP